MTEATDDEAMLGPLLHAIDTHWLYGTPDPDGHHVYAHQEHEIRECPAVIETARLLVAWQRADADEANHERDGCFADDDAMCAHKSIAAEAREAYRAAGEGA